MSRPWKGDPTTHIPVIDKRCQPLSESHMLAETPSLSDSPTRLCGGGRRLLLAPVTLFLLRSGLLPLAEPPWEPGRAGRCSASPGASQSEQVRSLGLHSRPLPPAVAHPPHTTTKPPRAAAGQTSSARVPARGPVPRRLSLSTGQKGPGPRGHRREGSGLRPLRSSSPDRRGLGPPTPRLCSAVSQTSAYLSI